ncbi:hypothetical protein LTR94_028579 [Friedmanniomyces endolithicus]|nr:hypothetical protein LTR94_028579 [Friedmanniomyces endolithicus]
MVDVAQAGPRMPELALAIAPAATRSLLINTIVDDRARPWQLSSRETRMVEDVRIDILVIGAGLAGLRALHTFRTQGFGVQVLEASDEIGGVWNFNRYPGARCDVESFDYSYRFSEELEQEWRWSERYAKQPEILRYINHVADRFDLRRDVSLNTRVRSAVLDPATGRWRIEAEDGRAWSAQRFVMAVGQLSTPKATTGTLIRSASFAPIRLAMSSL